MEKYIYNALVIFKNRRMFWVLCGLYTLGMVGIWGFVAVARIHTFKFKHYSSHIVPVTHVLVLVLATLTLMGYYFIFTADLNAQPQTTVQSATSNGVY